ncbi:lipid kinase YegS [Modicisalibacter ilicicola DSM 19980]|uniref:Lipid kinase YegS n=1 Tax=Modicisalibacter ilicicola DSM 19980 TaxID=1121942 RepID=A0A1M5BH83_9GAMM|nr:lipid kinase YegS [Halomonas ilicicola]SHF41944.1 lipid kinase YegS [Halomonas ilicicola DSM 19980]
MADSMARTTRLILNGKSSQIPEVRDAVEALRREGHELQVRVTWEAGDSVRFVHGASRDGIGRVIAGGGDGSVNEIVNGLMQLDEARRPSLGVLPLGSANDFAHGLGLPMEPLPALRGALSASSRAVDVGHLGDDYFINMASGGFGAEVTTSTPRALKRVLGGGAYALMGMFKVWHYRPYSGRVRWSDGNGEGEIESPLFLLAIGNGSQAGGGQELAPDAKVDDGLFDVLIVRHFSSMSEMRQLMAELERIPENGDFVHTVRTSRVSFRADGAFPLNLDGEPRYLREFEATLMPRAIRLLVPASSPLLSSTSSARAEMA